MAFIYPEKDRMFVRSNIQIWIIIYNSGYIKANSGFSKIMLTNRVMYNAKDNDFFLFDHNIQIYITNLQ